MLNKFVTIIINDPIEHDQMEFVRIGRSFIINEHEEAGTD